MRTYFKVWAALLLLLAVTVSVSYIHLGWFNTFAAISIAVAKALVIAMYFMHLRYSSRIMWLFAGVGFFWLLILFTLSLGEYMTRPWLPAPTKVTPQTASGDDRNGGRLAGSRAGHSSHQTSGEVANGSD